MMLRNTSKTPTRLENNQQEFSQKTLTSDKSTIQPLFNKPPLNFINRKDSQQLAPSSQNLQGNLIIPTYLKQQPIIYTGQSPQIETLESSNQPTQQNTNGFNSYQNFQQTHLYQKPHPINHPYLDQNSPQVYETADFYPQNNNNKHSTNKNGLQILDQYMVDTESYSSINPSSLSNDQQHLGSSSATGTINYGGMSSDHMQKIILLQQQEYQLLKEKNGLIYSSSQCGPSNDDQIIKRGSIGESCGGFISLHQYHSSNDDRQRELDQMLQQQDYSLGEISRAAENNYEFLTHTQSSSMYSDQQNIPSSPIRVDGQPLIEQIENDDEYFSGNEDEQRRLAESIGVQDQEFKENLFVLYKRRIQSAQTMLDQINIELQKVRTHQDYMNNLKIQLANNKNNCISQLKIRHHMLALKLDALLEEAMDQVFTSEQRQNQMLDQRIKDANDQLVELEATFQMVELKMRMEKKTKFVQFYPDMVKQCDRVLDQQRQAHLCNEQVNSDWIKIEQPPFDFQILSQIDYEELVNRPQTLLIDKSLQCNLEQPVRVGNMTQRSTINDREESLQRTFDRRELDEQAKDIRKNLKTLKKEAEFAKKLILNERKLDNLLGVLDRSRESIYRQSIDAYDMNQSIITDYTNLPPHAKLTPMGTMMAEGVGPLVSHRSSQKPPIQSHRSQNRYNNLLSIGQGHRNSQTIMHEDTSKRSLDKHTNRPQSKLSLQVKRNSVANIKASESQTLQFDNNAILSPTPTTLYAQQKVRDNQQTIVSKRNLNTSIDSKENHGLRFNQSSLSRENIHLSSLHTPISQDLKKNVKEKSYRFSKLKMRGDEKSQSSSHLRVYLPFNYGGQGEQFMSYHEVKIQKIGVVKVSEFLNRLLRHLKIGEQVRQRFFLSMEMKPHTERILSMEEDLNNTIANAIQKNETPLIMYLKESIYC